MKKLSTGWQIILILGIIAIAYLLAVNFGYIDPPILTSEPVSTETSV